MIATEKKHFCVFQCFQKTHRKNTLMRFLNKPMCIINTLAKHSVTHNYVCPTHTNVFFMCFDFLQCMNG